MVTIFIALIAYLVVESGVFGADILAMLNILEIWFWILLIPIGVLALFVIFYVGATGTKIGRDAAGNAGVISGTIAGYTIGSFIAALLVLKVTLQLLLTNWLLDHISPLAQNIDDLTNTQLLGLISLLAVTLIPLVRSSSSKN